LDRDFKSKPIKRRRVKLHVNNSQHHSILQMSSQITNNYMTAPTSPNPYITRKLNNINEAKLFKKKHDNWTKLYHKMLKELEAMINVQRQVKDMMKIAKETNTKMEGIILKASINN